MRPTIFALALAVLLSAGAPQAIAADNNCYGPCNNTPSYALLRGLSAIQALGAGDLSALQSWAGNTPVQMPNPVFSPLDQVKAQIVTMQPRDRDAVVTWLQGKGRGALYARGATDAQIGPCLFPIDPGGCNGPSTGPTPNPNYRIIALTLAPEASDASGIVIAGGFAAAKNDGTSLIQCLTFRNAGAKTATMISFTYQLLAYDGTLLESAVNQRSGTFSPSITIAGPAALNDYTTLKGGVGNRDQLNNCWVKDTGLASISILRAGYIAMSVTGVTYSDGTTWPNTAPPTAPAPTPTQ
jgi:hypothetical protein